MCSVWNRLGGVDNTLGNISPALIFFWSVTAVGQEIYTVKRRHNYVRKCQGLFVFMIILEPSLYFRTEGCPFHLITRQDTHRTCLKKKNEKTRVEENNATSRPIEMKEGRKEGGSEVKYRRCVPVPVCACPPFTCTRYTNIMDQEYKPR